MATPLTLDQLGGEGSLHEGYPLLMAVLEGAPNLAKLLRASSTGDLKITLDGETVVLAAGSAIIGKVKITDGTEDALVDAAGNLMVAVGAALPAGANIIGSVKLSDGVELALVDAAGNLMVSLGTALPAGENKIGQVEILDSDGNAIQRVTEDSTVALPVLSRGQKLLAATLAPTTTTFADVIAAPGASRHLRFYGASMVNLNAAQRGIQIRFTDSGNAVVFLHAAAQTAAPPIFLQGDFLAAVSNKPIQASLTANTAGANEVIVTVYYTDVAD